MSTLMCVANLLATDPLFQAACKTDPSSALTQRGLSLNGDELHALKRVWKLVAHRLESQEWPPIDDPDSQKWW